MGGGAGERHMEATGDTCKIWIIRSLEILLRNLGFLWWVTESYQRFVGRMVMTRFYLTKITPAVPRSTN